MTLPFPTAQRPGRRLFFLRNLLVAVAAILLSIAFAYHSRLHYERQARISAENLALVLGNHVTSAVEKIDLVLRTVAQETLQRQTRQLADGHDIEVLLAQQQSLLQGARNLLIADSSGIFIHGADVPPGSHIGSDDLDYFARLRDNPWAGLVIGGPYRNPIDRQWVMVFARRLNRPDGTFAGVVSAIISTEYFREMLLSLNLGSRGLVALRTSDLRTIARYPHLLSSEAIGTRVALPGLEENLQANPEYGTFIGKSPIDQVERRMAYRQLAGSAMYMVVGLATADYRAPWWREVLFLAATVGSLIGFAIWLTGRARRSAREHEASSRLLAEAVGSVGTAFAIFDPDDRLVISNQAVHDFLPEIGTSLLPGVRFETLIRNAVAWGVFPDAAGDAEDWIRNRVLHHQLGDGKPRTLRLRDGRELLVVERRTPSGHLVMNGTDITEQSQYRQHLESQVESRTADLKAVLDQLYILIELSPTALAMVDRNLRYLAASRSWIIAHGNGCTHLAGLHLHEASPGFPEHWKAVHHAALEGVVDSCEEDVWLQPDGSRRWLRWAVHPWINISGQVGGIIVFTEDITARKLAEQALAEEREARQRILEHQVAERTAELQTANGQLEGFLFAASHDLRGPLGRIGSFSGLLERDYRDRLEGNGLLYLDFIRDNALRLTTLIDDLLDHARIGQQPFDLQTINLPDAVKACLGKMEEDIREAGATISLELPPVEVLADRYGLDQVIHNLLENALKYCAGSDNPKIWIGGEMSGDLLRLWIRDNGIGFAMEYHDRIFEIFRRLHTQAEYAGSGVGLALVKRAMERMGGRVWAESEPGRGATFFLEFATVSKTDQPLATRQPGCWK